MLRDSHLVYMQGNLRFCGLAMRVLSSLELLGERTKWFKHRLGV